MTELSVTPENSGRCATFERLQSIERELRKKVYASSNDLVAARLGNEAIAAQKQRYRHMDSCPVCLRVEAA